MLGTIQPILQWRPIFNFVSFIIFLDFTSLWLTTKTYRLHFWTSLNSLLASAKIDTARLCSEHLKNSWNKRYERPYTRVANYQTSWAVVSTFTLLYSEVWVLYRLVGFYSTLFLTCKLRSARMNSTEFHLHLKLTACCSARYNNGWYIGFEVV